MILNPDPKRTKLKVAIIVFLVFLMYCPVISQDQKSNRQTSIEAFNNGQFENAYEGFRQMLLVYPKDPVYKYYTGACLVEMGKDAPEAESLLNAALGSGSLRSLPQDALFYLARAQHMKGDYSNAEKNYKKFEIEAGKKKAKELNVQQFIAQCRAGEGKSDALQVVAEDKTGTETKTVAESMPPKETKPEPPLVIKEREYLPTELDSALGDILVGQAKSANTNPAAVVAEEKTVAAVIPEKASKVEEPKKIDIPANPNLARQGIFSVFEILQKVAEKPISINPEIPEGLVYRIQIAVFRNPVITSYFKGITPVEGFKASGSTVTTYYAGLFRKNDDARKALASIRNLGFKDSFIAAQMNGKAVSAERASLLEKEWGSKTLFSFVTPGNSIELDTVPPTLHFRVEVARTIKPYDTEETESMRKVAGNLGLDIRQIESGNIVYLIGNFITFESAEDYADLLQKNGYREARVAAWLGAREIDLATARELFDNLQ